MAATALAATSVVPHVQSTSTFRSLQSIAPSSTSACQGSLAQGQATAATTTVTLPSPVVWKAASQAPVSGSTSQQSTHWSVGASSPKSLSASSPSSGLGMSYKTTQPQACASAPQPPQPLAVSTWKQPLTSIPLPQPSSQPKTWDDKILSDWKCSKALQKRPSGGSAKANVSAPEEVPAPGTDGRFVDTSFFPGDMALGYPKNSLRAFLEPEERAATQWIRVQDIMRFNEGLHWNAPVPLSPDISPDALTQGQVGNCWLLAAVAALAEFPSAIKSLFVSTDVPNGRYVVRLFNMNSAKWEHVTIDDYVPCVYKEDRSECPHTVDENLDRVFRWEDLHNEDGSVKVPKRWIPHFTKPHGREIWAVLLEKAMAKFVGSYGLIAGGTEPYAFMALTGMPLIYCFARYAQNDEGSEAAPGLWQWCGAQYFGPDFTGVPYGPVCGSEPELDDEEMWSRLHLYSSRRYMTTVSITKYQKPVDRRGFFRRDGLVSGHAYTVLGFHALPYMHETETRECVEWVDADGDKVGFERIGDSVFALCNGRRFQPCGVEGSVAIAELNICEATGTIRTTDTMNVTMSGRCPVHKCAELRRLWSRCGTPAAHSSSSSEPASLPPGTRVRFRGLQSQAHLNGSCGEVLGPADAKHGADVYRVRLVVDLSLRRPRTLSDSNDASIKIVKRTNLERVSELPGLRGGVLRLVKLRNPHGEGELDMDGTLSTKWKGDWSDNSSLWQLYPKVAEQVKHHVMNDGVFWMSWDDFKQAFDKICVVPLNMSPQAEQHGNAPIAASALPGKPKSLCPTLQAMVDRRPHEPLEKQLQAVEVIFDPFEQMPAFINNGSLETRLRWEACKPGRLQGILDSNKAAGNVQGYNHTLKLVHELGLTSALGANGHL